MKWKTALPLFLVTLALLPTGCGESSTKPLSPEEAKAIIGEDPNYLPGPGATKKAK